MADGLYQLLKPHLKTATTATSTPEESDAKYLARVVSLKLADLTTTEPQSLAQSSQSNIVSIQALSSRSHRTTTTSSDHLSTLRESLPLLSSSIEAIRSSIPELDRSTVEFASSYSKSKDDNPLLKSRKDAMLLTRQADKAQDILDLPNLLSAAIASASTAGAVGTGGSGASYSQALDLFAHIKRLQILYPESQLVKSVLHDAEIAMKDMTTNLITSLRSQNIRLAAAIRTIGWLRRVAPQLDNTSKNTVQSAASKPMPLIIPSIGGTQPASAAPPGEGHFGALFLCARLATFLSMTEALSPLRDLADQETAVRKSNHQRNTGQSSKTTSHRLQLTRKHSSGVGSTYNPALQGQQTERYLKRYIEIFREQSFATISVYRNIFPSDEEEKGNTSTSSNSSPISSPALTEALALPSALQSFPLHLVSLLTETLRKYLPNVTDQTSRESLLMQVLYAANSLGRLGADFSLVIASLEEDDDDDDDEIKADENTTNDALNAVSAGGENENSESQTAVDVSEELEDETHEENKAVPAAGLNEPEWVAIIKKHRVQAARLEALSAGQERVSGHGGSMQKSDVPVR
ncbi:uncharacterized protein A1O9_02337 [Exophiala aquamarina CBS 119918]|uniref:Conserved oligomeric Golgi complex subunit 8 n=1 Tax=Exophiala aquamarina CBS 119918 TaxID=1182545 RepID=A0A072PYW2_9EURO|nr:uncharacterized protein A1O9_02337 [Exophiala aquamarina CBS 119918]KEF60775.1 hypothetical protein A1O9_02337 [Exophiala aquamarina CBS 119918]